MKKISSKGMKGFAVGVAVTAVMTVPFTSYAETLKQSIAVTYNDILVKVNGTTVTLKDASGNALEPFNYNGSVYVPLRGVSEALGMNVTYDSANKTVNIAGSSSSSTGAASTDGKDGSPPDGMPPEGSPGGTPPSGTNGAAANRVTDVAANIVNDPAESDESVVALTKAFMATLSDDELESLQYDMTADNAAVWSNLPVGAAQRNGLMLGSLDEDSLDAFKSLAAAALGNSGYDTLKSIILADEYLTTDTGNNMWDSDLYYVAVLGEPSDTSPWILQIGGHHYATNLTYNTATESPTPMFVGVEPQTFTSNGVTYSPLESRRSAMYSMINSLSDTELSSAKISKTYDDVLLGPGQDNKFPTTSEGILVSSLDSSQKELVKAAITAWVQDTSPDISEELLASYLSDDALNQTKIGWSGSTDSTVHGSYIRIDGPRVWIEFVCQTGVAYTDQIHFHTVWRDKTADYGGSFGG